MDKLVITGEDFTPVLEDILSAGGQVSLVVSGTSMSPFLKHGRDVVRLCSCAGKELSRGQIVLFQRPDRSIILHRIRRVLPEGRLVMNGDAQVWCETISARQVIAIVAAVERNGRSLSCDDFGFRLWNWLWYPTRPIRPVLLKLGHVLFSRNQ